ncbi:MAG: hypothetical protein WAX07_10150 [Candidatus Altiarchaeia archaeon]|jgi:hypothetical protein
MEEVVLRMQVPEDLARDLKGISKEDWSLFVGRVLREKIERVAALEKALKKSKLTQKKADELADKINTDLAERYEKLYKKSYS